MATTLVELLPILAQLSRERGARVSLAQLADLAGKSPFHFQRTFARLMAESPKQYTLRLSLEAGAVLLLRTEASIVDIALQVGFDSHDGFGRAFARQFGLSPSAFRARGLDLEPAAVQRHAALVTHVGPCLHLFRVPLHAPTPKAEPMPYDIVQQTLPPSTVLYQTTRVQQAKIAEALGPILGALYQYATSSGIALAGPPFTRYVSWGPGMVTLEAGLAVAPGSPGTADIHVANWPGGPAAVTIHTGPYDALPDAHAAMETWLHEQGLAAGGAPVEVYLTDPGEVPDPKDWKTQIIWPIAG